MLRCQRCDTTEGVQLEDSRTAYVNDPNAPVPLCRACAKDHHAYWDELWEQARPSI